jgi:hypothetical protein
MKTVLNGGKYVVVHRYSRMLGLEIMMEITSIQLPPSELFAGKEPTTIKFYIGPLHPVKFPDSGLHATQSLWLPGLHRLRHATQTKTKDSH